MIKNIINLTKIFLISAFNRGGNRKRKNRIGRIVLYGLIFAYLIGVFGFLSYEILSGLIVLKQEEAFIGYILMAIITLVLFTTIISTMNVLYFSSDNRFVLPLPFKPLEVLSAKLNTLLVYVYMEEAMLGLIPMIMYGIMTKQNIIYYLLLIPVLIAVPVVPLLIATLIVICVMALTKGIRNKSLVQTITMIVSIVFSLTISMFSSSMSSSEDITALMNTAGSLVEIFKKAFPTMPMAVNALTSYNVLSLCLLIVVSTAAYALVCVLGQKPYYRGMLGSLYSSSGVSDRKIDEKSAYRSRGLPFSYVMKEIRVYLRRPTFFVQLILPCLIIPAFMMGITYFSVFSQVGSELMEGLQQIYAEKAFGGYVYAILLLAVMFISMYSFISTLAISKDGHDAYAMKYLPVAFHKQLIYKMIPDVVMCLFSYLNVALLSMILFRLPPIYVLMSLPVSVLYCILHGFLILSDVRRPKLDWTNEMQIVKKNFRTMFSLAFSLLNMGIVAVLAFLIGVRMIVMTVILTVFYGLIDYLLYRYIRSKDIRLADGFE
ncbi:MAG: hypothetical protein IIZ64_02485 [Erysipelotrichaceae bacterium]|nr:hypothetical protein [Erysipelotrichaceae bacterium]